MILQNVELQGLKNIVFPVINAQPTDNYILKEAWGLGPAEVDVFIADTLFQGGLYQGRRPRNREVVLRVGLNPDYKQQISASQLRQNLYNLLTSYNPVNIHVTTDIVEFQIKGYVKTIEVAIFTKEPEVQITIPCLSPYFEGMSELSIPAPPVDDAPIIFENPGSAPTEFYAELEILNNQPGQISKVRIAPLLDTSDRYVEVSYAFLPNDVITFNTKAGVRQISLLRSGQVPINLIRNVNDKLGWFYLEPGANVIHASSGIDDSWYLSFKWNAFKFTPQYWGV